MFNYSEYPLSTQNYELQAIYLQILHEAAQKQARSQSAPIDPQGRIIIDVKLNEEIWKNIYHVYKEVYPQSPWSIASLEWEEDKTDKDFLFKFKEEFKKGLGHPIQETVSVSLDFQTPSGENIHERLLTALKKYLPEESGPILQAYQGLAKGRIIALQQETHFHAHLVAQMARTAVSKAGTNETQDNQLDKEFQKGVESALLVLNDTVLRLQANALKEAYSKSNKDGTVDQEKFAASLNSELDKARKELLPEIAKAVRIGLIQETHLQFDEKITRHLSKQLAERTSATANDYIHVDKGSGLISFIGANEHTSHHQSLGKDYLADRMFYSHYYKEKGESGDDVEIIPLSHRQHIRVPSIAVKKLHPMTIKLLDEMVQKKKGPLPQGNLKTTIKTKDSKNKLSTEEHEQIVKEYEEVNKLLTPAKNTYTKQDIKKAIDQLIVQDTKEKINHLQDKYKLGHFPVKEKDGIPQAFVYNLYTSLNKNNLLGMIDEWKNRQNQSADHILRAAHTYNRQRSQSSSDAMPLCLVQNIPVNGWGHALSIQKANPDLVNEAALMAQMATLHTIYEVVKDQLSQEKIKSLFKAYEEFLTQDKDHYFYNYLKNQKQLTQILDTLNLLQKEIKIDEIPNPTKREVPNPVEKEVPYPSEKPQKPEVLLNRERFTNQAKFALASLFKANAFNQHKNGYTYQALSVFVENSSFGGCKSANERAQAVNGRVSILDFISLGQQTRNELLKKYLSKNEANRLITIANNLEFSILNSNSLEITKNLDALYGALNLEGFQAIISLIDQGGHAKLGTKKGLIPNTNNAETVLTHVKYASSWQCHKGLIKHVLKEFCGIEKINYGKELMSLAKSTSTSAIGGGALGTAAFGISLALGITAAPSLLVLAGGAAVTSAGINMLAGLRNILNKNKTRHPVQGKDSALKQEKSLEDKKEYPQEATLKEAKTPKIEPTSNQEVSLVKRTTSSLSITSLAEKDDKVTFIDSQRSRRSSFPGDQSSRQRACSVSSIKDTLHSYKKEHQTENLQSKDLNSERDNKSTSPKI